MIACSSERGGSRRSTPRRTAAASELLDRAVDRLPLTRSRARAGRPRRPHHRRARRLLRRPARARRGGALVPVAGGAVPPVTVRRLRRGDTGYPTLLGQIPDPPPSLWLRGRGGRRAARVACRRDRRCSRVLRLRAIGRPHARDRGGRGRRRRRERARARHRRRGAPGRARRRRADRRGARLRDRSRLPGRARRARPLDRRDGRPDRLRVRAGGRSPLRGASRRGTGSSPGLRARPSSSRRASGRAR